MLEQILLLAEIHVGLLSCIPWVISPPKLADCHTVAICVYVQMSVYIVVNVCLSLFQSYGDEPLDNILMHVEDGPVVELDRWVLSVWPNEEVSREVSLFGWCI